MNFFKDQSMLYRLFGLFLAFIFVYFQLAMRKERIISSVFREGSLYRLVPENILNLKKIKDRLLIISLLLITLSVSGPQWGREFMQSEGFSGNIAVAIDTSLSMAAQDIRPSRIESAKLAVKYVFKDLPDYKFAVLAFQGKPYIQCPMTSDYDALTYFADGIRPDMLPSKGTNIPAVIKLAASYLSRYEGEKLLVLITDGEDHHSDELKDALSSAEKASMKILAVSIGTREGDLLKDPKTGEYKKDSAGNTVISRLNEELLVEIAGKTRGKYVKYTTPENISEEIKAFADSMKKARTSSSNSQIYKDHYQIPLLLAFLLIMIEFILMEEKISFSISLGGRKIFSFILLLFAASNVRAENAQIEAARGNDMYRKGDFSKAYDYYKNAYEKGKNEKILFNLGNSLHKMEEYNKAAEVFESVKDRDIKSKALYNAGNSRLMAGDKEKAIKNYRHAILINPKDKKAIYNLQVALESKNPPPSKDQNKDKQNNQDKDKQDQNENSNQDKQQQNKSDSPEKKRAEQLLNMMKEKEKENRKKADRQKASPQSSDEYEKEDW
ncbi:MAG: hypothetical protein Fur0012_06290 [Elusimicrobiota bacterium]